MRKMHIAAKQSGMMQFLQKGSEPLCMYAYHLECGEWEGRSSVGGCWVARVCEKHTPLHISIFLKDLSSPHN